MNQQTNHLPSTRRRHPLVWQAASVIVLIVFILIVRLAWGWYVQRIFDREIAALRATGQPVMPEDLVYPPLPDDQNAFTIFSQAAAKVSAVVDSPRASNLVYTDYPPFTPAWHKMAEASERANAAVFDVARKARPLAKSQFRMTFPSPNNILLPSLNGTRALANTLADGATYSHVRGDDSEAIERLLDVEHLANSLRQDDLMISQLVGIGIDALDCYAIEIIAPGLRFDRSATTQPATQAQVRQLIARLLDETQNWEGMRNTLVVERVTYVDFLRRISKKTWFIRPFLQTMMVKEPRIAVAMQASRATNWPAAKNVFAGAAGQSGSFAATQMFGSMDRYFETHFRVLVDRRIAAISLAVQLYRADHARWPATLAELVPAYLPAIPVDPYATDGRPMGYVIFPHALPDGLDRPMAFAECGNAEDPFIDSEPMYGWQTDTRPGKPRSRAMRQYRDLSRWKPAARRVDEAASVMGAEDESNKTDTPGNQKEQDNAASQPAK